jgi:hypothetical protein
VIEGTNLYFRKDGVAQQSPLCAEAEKPLTIE